MPGANPLNAKNTKKRDVSRANAGSVRIGSSRETAKRSPKGRPSEKTEKKAATRRRPAKTRNTPKNADDRKKNKTGKPKKKTNPRKAAKKNEIRNFSTPANPGCPKRKRRGRRFPRNPSFCPVPAPSFCPVPAAFPLLRPRVSLFSGTSFRFPPRPVPGPSFRFRAGPPSRRF